jgi:hypothetical protein
MQERLSALGEFPIAVIIRQIKLLNASIPEKLA